VDKLQPIDIRDPLTRKAALEAMFDDDWQAIEPQLKTAADAKSIPPILPAIDAITRLRPLDVAAAGTDQRTSESAAKLVDHAKKLMTAALDQMKKRIDDISDAANTESVSTQTIFMQGIASQVQTRTKQGLTDRNIRELRDMISTCQKITPAAQTLANAGTKVDIQDVLSESDEVQSKAKDLLDTRF
jgi:nitrogen regulatory protein PII